MVMPDANDRALRKLSAVLKSDELQAIREQNRTAYDCPSWTRVQLRSRGAQHGYFLSLVSRARYAFPGYVVDYVIANYTQYGQYLYMDLASNIMTELQYLLKHPTILDLA